MKILFIQTRNDIRILKEPSTPLGLLYLASVARQKGHLTYLSICSNREGSIKEILTKIRKQSIDVCALSSYTAQILNQYHLMHTIKEYSPNCKIVFGGPHASALPQKTMEECEAIDYLIYGEGEITFGELLDGLTRRNSLEGIDGLVYRDGAEIIANKPRDFMDDLNTLPYPAHDLFLPFLPEDGRHAIVITSRGCPYNCEFCYKGIFGLKYRRRCPENVIEEIKILVKQYNVRFIAFADDLFALNKEWLSRFYTKIEENKLNFWWECMGRVTSYSNADCLQMKKYGCVLINYGIESGNDEILKSIGKKTNVAQIRTAIRTTKEAGIFTRGFYIFGHRNETLKTMEDTLNIALENKTDSAIFFTMVPFPGSKAYSYVPEKLRYRWDLFYDCKKTGFRPISICQLSPEIIWKFSSKAIARYYGSLFYFRRVVLNAKIPKIERREALLYWLCGILARFFNIRFKLLFDLMR